jgi:hypothetical protein
MDAWGPGPADVALAHVSFCRSREQASGLRRVDRGVVLLRDCDALALRPCLFPAPFTPDAPSPVAVLSLSRFWIFLCLLARHSPFHRFGAMHAGRPEAWPSSDDEYECIDLTGESPDPPPHPLPPLRRAPQQQQLARYFKSESREMAPSSARGRPSGDAPPNINPDQLRQIINTSDPASVRTVLLNLCKLSPALSGAVARGLAPSSTFAQDTIRAYQNGTTTSSKASGSRQTATHTSRDMKNSYPVTPYQPRTKHAQTKAVSISSDDESTLDDPEYFFKTEEHSCPSMSGGDKAGVKSERQSFSALPVRHSQPASIETAPSIVKAESATAKAQPASLVKKEPTKIKSEPTERKCMQCRQPFNDEFEPCVYHTGRVKIGTNDYGAREAAYDCCGEDVDHPGCQYGVHEAEDMHEPTDRSPTVLVREPKRARRG